MKVKVGDRILRPFKASPCFNPRTRKPDLEWVTAGPDQRDPGVLVADLVRECELAVWLRANYGEGAVWVHKDYCRNHWECYDLTHFREAAKKLDFPVVGQEVEVRGVVRRSNNGTVGVSFRQCDRPHRVHFPEFHPDDIRPVENERESE